ncbi:hypothetical protein GCM10008022_09050 [Paenibacillus hunanensis]|nr:hypothetical protein GCM10008022_09050 [Paenibacillus hunanensis]
MSGLYSSVYMYTSVYRLVMEVDVGFFERWFYRDKLTSGVHLHLIAGIGKRYSIRTPFVTWTL